ncbi:MAG: hypothetical protein MZV63_14020 [Marinilabiliales bacterium]|nr:hypothetical protein [Marinilabiliales bacterium]
MPTRGSHSITTIVRTTRKLSPTEHGSLYFRIAAEHMKVSFRATTGSPAGLMRTGGLKEDCTTSGVTREKGIMSMISIPMWLPGLKRWLKRPAMTWVMTCRMHLAGTEENQGG